MGLPEFHTDGVALLHAYTLDEWRGWLAENHLSKRSIWLVRNKRSSGLPYMDNDDAVDEAICYGWIDSKVNKFNDTASLQYFARRSESSNWSKVNKEKVARLLAEGRMQPAGLEAIAKAKENGTWDALDEVEKLTEPNDLKEALDKNRQARSYFNAFPRSSRRGILEWIHNAKRPETRAARIQETVTLAAENVRANHYKQPKGKTGGADLS